MYGGTYVSVRSAYMAVYHAGRGLVSEEFMTACTRHSFWLLDRLITPNLCDPDKQISVLRLHTVRYMRLTHCVHMCMCAYVYVCICACSLPSAVLLDALLQLDCVQDMTSTIIDISCNTVFVTVVLCIHY